MEKEQRNDLIRLAAAAVIYAAIKFAGFSEKTEFYLLFIPYLIAGIEVLTHAIKNIIKGHIFDENFLMAVASAGAFLTGQPDEAAAVMLFFGVGELFEDMAVDKSRRSVDALLDIMPDHANVLRGGKTENVQPSEVDVGEIIIVKPGERVPLDGKVEDGASMLDTSSLTGESVPACVGVGDEILSGCINTESPLTVKVTKPYSQSTVERIRKLVESSVSKKSRTENFITRFSRIYTPAVVGGALLLAVIPSLITGEWALWVHRALIFLVVSCPCALVVSIPMAFFAGIGASSRKGILVKGSNYLEALSKCSVMVFDKTGTLTKGSFKVTGIYPRKLSEERLLEIAACAEAFSNHPIAAALRRAYGKETDKTPAGSVREIPGRGVFAVVDDVSVYCGNEALMRDSNVECDEYSGAGTTVHICVDGRYAGFIVIGDEIKQDAAATVKQLRRAGVSRLIMLTGDREEEAVRVAEKIGFTEFSAGLLPQDKASRIEELYKEKQSGTLVFVGDGVNDAPVLARADAGIAMGALGSDAAIEASDIVIADDSLSKLPKAVRIAKKTMSVARGNIIFSLVVKGAVLLMSALGLGNMWLAVFADVGVAILAVLNSTRVLYIHDEM